IRHSMIRGVKRHLRLETRLNIYANFYYRYIKQNNYSFIKIKDLHDLHYGYLIHNIHAKKKKIIS
ncbi:hypothetical protein ALC53_07967, partial [Atta colombica]